MFRIGDTVRIISKKELSYFPEEFEGDHRIDRFYFNSLMEVRCGRLAKIVGIGTDTYTLLFGGETDPDRWNWTEKMFHKSRIRLDEI